MLYKVLVSSRLPSSTRYGAEAEPRGQFRSGTRRSRELTVLVHGHTENSLLYHPLFDKLVGYSQVVAPSKGVLYQVI